MLALQCIHANLLKGMTMQKWLATLRLKEIDIFHGSLLVAAYPLRGMGGYGGVYGS